MNKIVVLQKSFTKILDATTINKRVKELANEILSIYSASVSDIQVLVIMNGSFMFASDLIRHLDVRFNLHFVRVQSYAGMIQDSDIKITAPFDWNILKSQNVLIIEDIIESGNTVNALLEKLKEQNTTSIHFVSLIVKPKRLQHNFEKLMTGFEIDDEFIIGYGMDYNGLGRGLPDIFQLENLPNCHIE